MQQATLGLPVTPAVRVALAILVILVTTARLDKAVLAARPDQQVTQGLLVAQAERAIPDLLVLAEREETAAPGVMLVIRAALAVRVIKALTARMA